MEFPLTLTEKRLCANCAKDRSNNLIGVCYNCLALQKQGAIVKIKDTMDKDKWSCGCGISDYGGSHIISNCPRHKHIDLLTRDPRNF